MIIEIKFENDRTFCGEMLSKDMEMMKLSCCAIYFICIFFLVFRIHKMTNMKCQTDDKKR